MRNFYLKKVEGIRLPAYIPESERWDVPEDQIVKDRGMVIGHRSFYLFPGVSSCIPLVVRNSERVFLAMHASNGWSFEELEKAMSRFSQIVRENAYIEAFRYDPLCRDWPKPKTSEEILQELSKVNLPVNLTEYKDGGELVHVLYYPEQGWKKVGDRVFK